MIGLAPLFVHAEPPRPGPSQARILIIATSGGGWSFRVPPAWTQASPDSFKARALPRSGRFDRMYPSTDIEKCAWRGGLLLVACTPRPKPGDTRSIDFLLRWGGKWVPLRNGTTGRAMVLNGDDGYGNELHARIPGRYSSLSLDIGGESRSPQALLSEARLWMASLREIPPKAAKSPGK